MDTTGIILNDIREGGSFVDSISQKRFLFYSPIPKAAEHAFLCESNIIPYDGKSLKTSLRNE